MKEYIGSYVLYGTEDGRFLWGKIKAVVRVNTMDGEKESFVLTDRMSGPYENGHIEKYNRDTLVRKDKLNLETDIISRDFGGGFESLSDEDLFLLTLKSSDIEDGQMCVGLKNMLTAQSVESKIGEISEVAAQTLKRRLQVGLEKF
jgi:hypothetical protein